MEFWIKGRVFWVIREKDMEVHIAVEARFIKCGWTGGSADGWNVGQTKTKEMAGRSRQWAGRGAEVMKCSVCDRMYLINYCMLIRIVRLVPTLFTF